LLILLKILDPDNNSVDAWKIVHSGITTEHDVFLYQRNMICCVSRRFNNLKREMQLPKSIRINCDKAICKLFPYHRIPVFTFAKQRKNTAEKMREMAGTPTFKRILSTP
jgi:hypothetical protein